MTRKMCWVNSVQFVSCLLGSHIIGVVALIINSKGRRNKSYTETDVQPEYSSLLDIEINKR
jgi:hypothetical protein